MDFKQQFSYYVDIVNESLGYLIQEKDTPERIIYKAMKYSLMAGGKRLRPVLALSTADMLDGNLDEVIPFACAIEMIHTYSLIHDDLPAMDNDDYRRGRLTNHKVYGEALAILAGDGLLNLAFEVMLDTCAIRCENLKAKVDAMYTIARASGVTGMIGGQVVDLESEGKSIQYEILEYMHKCKTGALIKAPVLASAILCNAEISEMGNLKNFSEKIGLAFQIKDDILDLEGNDEMLGKKTGSDSVNNKSTFITIYGLDESKRLLREVTQQAIAAIEGFGNKSLFLKNLALYLLKREN